MFIRYFWGFFLMIIFGPKFDQWGLFWTDCYFVWRWTYYSLRALFSVTRQPRLSLIFPRPCPAPVRREPWLLTVEDKWKASIWGLSTFSVTWICRYLCACHRSCFKIFNLSPNFLAFPLSISGSTVSDGERHCPSSPQYFYHFLNWLTYFFPNITNPQPPVASSPWWPCTFPMLLPLPHHHHSTLHPHSPAFL